MSFAEQLAEPARSGVLRALELVPAHRVPIVTMSSASPWVSIDQMPGRPLVVWAATGAVFEVGEDGAVAEEPVA